MISKRTLEKWRKEALIIKEMNIRHEGVNGMSREMCLNFCNRIMTLTQELIDQQLLKK